jgi:hypothetical protein
MFIQRNDSLFLEGAEFGRKDPTLFRNKFIAEVHDKNGAYDYQVQDFNLIDMDLDGNRELVFTVMAGFTLTPRAVFCYNIVGDSLLSTKNDGAYLGINDIADLNGDRCPEILCSGYAINNYPSDAPIPYPDSLAWLMAFNTGMTFLFTPKGFHGYTSAILPVAFRSHGRNLIAAVYNNRSTMNYFVREMIMTVYF